VPIRGGPARRTFYAAIESDGGGRRPFSEIKASSTPPIALDALLSAARGCALMEPGGPRARGDWPARSRALALARRIVALRGCRYGTADKLSGAAPPRDRVASRDEERSRAELFALTFLPSLREAGFFPN